MSELAEKVTNISITPKGLEYLRLYREGHTYEEIDLILGGLEKPLENAITNYVTFYTERGHDRRDVIELLEEAVNSTTLSLYEESIKDNDDEQ